MNLLFERGVIVNWLEQFEPILESLYAVLLKKYGHHPDAAGVMASLSISALILDMPALRSVPGLRSVHAESYVNELLAYSEQCLPANAEADDIVHFVNDLAHQKGSQVLAEHYHQKLTLGGER